MKIALISAASSIHTARWANGLKSTGCEVHVISQHPQTEQFDDGVNLHVFPYRGSIGYFLMAPKVRKLLKRIKPDVVNAHYASGYGTTARLVGWRPWLLSVWGSDVYDFPHKSALHKWIVKKNLLAADRVASTSHCMSEVTRHLAPALDDIAITPFGVNMAEYEAIEAVEPTNQKELVIGTVKTMAYKYGIDTLIEAFALLRQQLGCSQPDLVNNIRLRLVGGGQQIDEYQSLAMQLGVAEKVDFIGRVHHEQVPHELAQMDIYVALSRLDSESFGVAIIEASAAGRPVVVSDAGGLPEVTQQNQTGLIVPRNDPQAAADAMRLLVLDPQLRQDYGVAGRQHVARNYSWGACVREMLSVLRELNNKN